MVQLQRHTTRERRPRHHAMSVDRASATACPAIVLRGQRTLEKCSVVRRASCHGVRGISLKMRRDVDEVVRWEDVAWLLGPA
jgi:hypothetical protein